MSLLSGRTIKHKLTIVQMVTCSVVMVVACLIFAVFSSWSTRRAVEDDLTGLARAIAANTEAALEFDIPEDAEGVLHSLQARPSIASAYLFNSHGDVFASYARDGKEAVADGGHSHQPGAHTDATGLLHIAVPIVGPDGLRPLGSLCLQDDLRTVRASTLRTVAVLGAVLVGGLVLAYILAISLQSSISGPVLQLTHTADAVFAHNDYTIRAPEDMTTGDEISVLAAAFNQMLGRIESRDNTLQREVAERIHAEEEVRQHRDNLEILVAERTRELERANEELRREVGEHERAEIRLRRTMEDLKRSNQELEKFAYVSSHDLQEPLRKMLAFSERLQNDAGDAVDARTQDLLNRICNAANRMHFLINDLLDFSRIGRTALKLSDVDLNHVVRDAIEDLHGEIDEAQADVVLGLLPVIEADHRQMRQLFRNLLSNALKFRLPESTPLIRVDAVPVDHSGYVTINIMDNGMGIDPKYHERVFDIFQRLNPRRLFEGTGMGLAIVRRIVEGHGGTVGVSGKEGAGATFHIALPIHQESRRHHDDIQEANV